MKFRMQSTNRYAFKEWAATCLALSEGRQSLLVRKGGIHERGGHFSVEHREFWLFPTQFHQTADDFRPDAAPLIAQAAAAALPPGIVRVELYAVINEVIELADESALAQLADLQILSEATLARRFHYRSAGLFVLPARIYRLSQPFELAESPHFAGCRTWVDLERDLPMRDLACVLSDAAHDQSLARIRDALGR
jgi:hypothetical protein